MHFHSVGIYLPTSYVQDTVLGAVKIVRKQVKQGPCSCRTYVLVGGDKQFGNWSIHLSASRKGNGQFIYRPAGKEKISGGYKWYAKN